MKTKFINISKTNSRYSLSLPFNLLQTIPLIRRQANYGNTIIKNINTILAAILTFFFWISSSTLRFSTNFQWAFAAITVFICKYITTIIAEKSINPAKPQTISDSIRKPEIIKYVFNKATKHCKQNNIYTKWSQMILKGCWVFHSKVPIITYESYCIRWYTCKYKAEMSRNDHCTRTMADQSELLVPKIEWLLQQVHLTHLRWCLHAKFRPGMKLTPGRNHPCLWWNVSYCLHVLAEMKFDPGMKKRKKDV